MLSSIQPVSEQLSALRIPRTGSTVVPVCGQLTSHLAVHVANKQSTKRKTIENHIARGFNQAYQAQITEFMPLLVALGRSKIEAALGVRTGEHKLFVETYFDQPLEQAMAEKAFTALAIDWQKLAIFTAGPPASPCPYYCSPLWAYFSSTFRYWYLPPPASCNA